MACFHKYIIGVLLSIATVVSACWFLTGNVDGTYIVSINTNVIYTTVVEGISATFNNNQQVSLPISVQLKVGLIDRPSDKVILAKLQYKVYRNGTALTTAWNDVKTINNPQWSLLFSMPVTLFGANGSILGTECESGDVILIRVYFMSELGVSNGNLNRDINPNDIINGNYTIYNDDNFEIGTSGWMYPHVIKVIFNGQRGVSI